MSRLNTKIISKNFSIGIIIFITFIILCTNWFIGQNYQKKMIKLDACIESCIGGNMGGGFLKSNAERRGCEARCREKYGMTEEKYGEWKEKNK